MLTWIEIEEVLPEEYSNVLVYCPEPDYRESNYVIAYWSDNNVWTCAMTDNRVCPTHWMELTNPDDE